MTDLTERHFLKNLNVVSQSRYVWMMPTRFCSEVIIRISLSVFVLLLLTQTIVCFYDANCPVGVQMGLPRPVKLNISNVKS